MRIRTVVTGGLMVLALTALASSASAVVVNIDASKDNSLYEDGAGSLSNGAGEYLFAGETAVGELRRGLIAFDVASVVPAGATIQAVELRLFYDKPPAGVTNGTQDISLRLVSADWGEGTSDASFQEGGGAPSTAGDATWLHTFFNTSLWTTPGGDFSGTVSATTTVDDEGFYSWTDAALVTDVQGWLDSPATNFGWGIFSAEGGFSTAKRFASRTHATTANRPVLIVTYDIDTPVVPTSWGSIKTLYR